MQGNFRQGGLWLGRLPGWCAEFDAGQPRVYCEYPVDAESLQRERYPGGWGGPGTIVSEGDHLVLIPSGDGDERT